jgi:hypothetical protein
VRQKKCTQCWVVNAILPEDNALPVGVGRKTVNGCCSTRYFRLRAVTRLALPRRHHPHRPAQRSTPAIQPTKRRLTAPAPAIPARIFNAYRAW